MEETKSMAERLYGPTTTPNATAPAANSVNQSPAAKAYWDTIASQTQREKAELPMEDRLYPNQRKTTEAAPVKAAESDKTAEQRTADDAVKAAAAQGQKTDGTDKAPEVPERYDFKLPEGTMTNPKQMDEISVMFKEDGFSNERAQKYVDAHLTSIGFFAQKLQEYAQATVKAWDQEVLSDKEIGGARYDETLDLAENVLVIADTKVPGFNGARLRANLVRTGMSNHPDMVRLMRYVGQNLNHIPLRQ